MHLRREVHLILWVSALIASASTLYCATLHASGSFEVFSTSSISDIARPDAIVPDFIFTGRRLTTAATDNARALFPASHRELPEAVAPLEPILKGILGSGATSRAVFLDPATGAYRTAGAGDVVGVFELQQVAADRVVLRSETGRRVVYLRGAGEQPGRGY